MADAHTPPAQDGQSKSVRFIVNILTIVGLVILGIIVIWGLIHLASLSSGWFASFFSSDKSASIEIHAPERADSGTPFALNWDYEPEEVGVFAIQYACADGLQMAVPAAEGRFQPIPCGASLVIGTSTTLALLPILSASDPVRAALSVIYISEASKEKVAEGAAIVVIDAGEAPAAPEPEPEDSVDPRPSGPADLTVAITGVSVDPGGNAVVTFNISNAGSGTSDTYSFTAQLPTLQPYTYVSSAQTPLSPGSYVVNTIRFSQAIPGTIMVTVSGDASTHNNTASQFLNAPYGQGYPYPY